MTGSSLWPRGRQGLVRAAAVLLCAAALSVPAGANRPAAAGLEASADGALLIEAREAARGMAGKPGARADRARLAAVRATLAAVDHPLLPWVDYWDLSGRLPEATADEVEAFYTRWRGSYVEDRLRNDWLLELGRRRDFAGIARDYPRFRMNDDREVSCWWLLTEHLAGRDVREAGRAAWLAQREADDGCQMLATALFDAKKLKDEDVWLKARLSIELQRPAAAKAAIGLIATPGNALARDAAEALDNPARFLRRPVSPRRAQQELRLLALMRATASDVEGAASWLAEDGLPASLSAWAWIYAARQAAFKQSPEALAHVRRALDLLPGRDPSHAPHPGWTDETLGWAVRATLRSNSEQRWPLMRTLIDLMSPAAQADPAWMYWRALAWRATARDGADGEPQRQLAMRTLESLSADAHFYGKLAAEALGRAPQLPPAPPALVADDLAQARALPGLQRALLLVQAGLRDEARREWNFTLRGMNDRQLRAAARLACDIADWQLCINTAERARGEVDLALRYPMPFEAEIRAAASAAGLDAPLVFGLIRQETRFMPQLKSHVGASGLMQVMPATARWVAKKIGMDWSRPEQIGDPAVNLKLGTSYLKLVLDDLGGNQAMAAAAYNAGPGRPRRWREGAVLDAAAWAESVPFNETRDYVKRVLHNAAVYDALLNQRPPALRARLGTTIGPRDPNAPTPNGELP
ncbi:MAG: lytic transglycosylase domain-containing protein [Burkholderiaceae bacterium]|nr:lytic transglycosylase domain-containing protein [Burkholderiaceae bacterium]